MVTSVRIRLAGLGTLLAAIYGLALACAIHGAPPPAIATGLSLDLTVTAAAATWWLGVRCGVLSRRAPLVVLGVGAMTARLALPAGTADLALAVVLALELLVLATIVARAPRLIRALRRAAHLPMIVRLADALEEVGLPRRLARILTTELSTFGLAVTGWVRRAPRRGFTVHRTHCTLAFHVVLGGLVVLETLVLHLLLARVSLAGAWISTGLSLYALGWLIGDAHALRLGRIRVERDAVVIEIARRWAAVIPRRAIAAVRPQTTVPDGAVDLSLETPTVAIELSEPITVRGPFGITRTGARLALTVDDAAGFAAALER